MGEFIVVDGTGGMKDGEMKAVIVAGKELLVARAGEKYYVTENRCPHLGGKLADGKLEGVVVTCPRHGSQFDVSSGRVVRWLKGGGVLSALGRALKKPHPLTVHTVKIEGDKLLVEV